MKNRKRGSAGGKQTLKNHGKQRFVLLGKFLWAIQRGEYKKGQFPQFLADLRTKEKK